MPWSKRQQIMLHQAAKAADWTTEHRYIAMRHVGCPTDRATGNPSVKHIANTQTMFELLMELAEAHAAEQGRTVPRPGEFRSWRDKCRSQHWHKWHALAKAIAHEAIERMPARFDQGLIQYAINHTTSADNKAWFGSPQGLEECTPGQLYRVIECLKAFVGREFARAGITPRSFDQPASVRRRTA